MYNFRTLLQEILPKDPLDSPYIIGHFGSDSLNHEYMYRKSWASFNYLKVKLQRRQENVSRGTGDSDSLLSCFWLREN